jgi:transposase-like protein
MIKQFKSLHEMIKAFPDDQSCIDHLRSIRWANGAFCPYCGSTRVYNFSDNRTHKCGDCRQRFSIKVGTIFEDSKIGLHKWFMAIYLLTSHKKGIASAQLARDIDASLCGAHQIVQ